MSGGSGGEVVDSRDRIICVSLSDEEGLSWFRLLMEFVVFAVEIN